MLMVAAAGFVGWSVMRTFLGKVAPEQARALVKDGAKLLDVRTHAEHASGHIPGSQNIPLDQLGSRITDLGDRARPVIVYCASGMRSASAASLLKRSGFAQVYDLGSMARWPG